LHWFLCPQEAYNLTLLFGNALLKHGRHFDYWNQPLNMRKRVCYLNCHEAGLCCYIVIHIGNLLRPLQLFYFYLWPFYWLPSMLTLFISGERTQKSSICSCHWTKSIIPRVWSRFNDPSH
jgi:uncharacterized membrane protein